MTLKLPLQPLARAAALVFFTLGANSCDSDAAGGRGTLEDNTTTAQRMLRASYPLKTYERVCATPFDSGYVMTFRERSMETNIADFDMPVLPVVVVRADTSARIMAYTPVDSAVSAPSTSASLRDSATIVQLARTQVSNRELLHCHIGIPEGALVYFLDPGASLRASSLGGKVVAISRDGLAGITLTF